MPCGASGSSSRSWSDFWSNHLNVTCPGDTWDSRHLYDSQVIRKYAFGKYKDMLLASAKHPAMLLYLNNEESTKQHPNENYGRELLELHTVGVDGGYDENDIYSSARILTGLTLRNPKPGTTDRPSWTRREFAFDPTIHDTSGGTILGFTWSNHAASTGLTQAENYITYLARHRKTAERIAYKLAVRFVSDAPPASLVSRLADVYQANDTAIVPVLRALFTSREFTFSSGMKVRRPYEDLIAGLRALDVRPSTNADFPTDGSTRRTSKGCPRSTTRAATWGTRRSTGARPTATPTRRSTGSRPTACSVAGTTTARTPRAGGRAARRTASPGPTARRRTQICRVDAARRRCRRRTAGYVDALSRPAAPAEHAGRAQGGGPHLPRQDARTRR